MSGAVKAVEQEPAVIPRNAAAVDFQPLDAVKEAYQFTNDTNTYRHLRELVQNPKIDAALKGLGMNLIDKFEKNAVAIIQAWEEIAFSKSTSTRDKLAALDKLAAYNPTLLTRRKKDADDTEEDDLTQRVGEFVNEK